MSTRAASHAGSWYSASKSTLSSQLNGWLGEVPSNIDAKDLPIEGARVIIAPHAGYEYSGRTAAWAYKSLDLSKSKRVFLLGPSHRLALDRCALSSHSYYATPLGDLKLDRNTIAELKSTNKFDAWRPSIEEAEHSLEMHLPYLYKMLSLQFETEADYPLLVPILVGSTNAQAEREYGRILAPYLEDPTSVFIVSSDFCHWGGSFRYTYYLPAPTSPQTTGYSLKSREKKATDPMVRESIERLDRQAMDAIEAGKHLDFLDNLEETGNTVCGRHPIGVVMAALERLQADGKISSGETGRFKFIRYARSSDPSDRDKDEWSSVSYASAVAVL